MIRIHDTQQFIVDNTLVGAEELGKRQIDPLVAKQHTLAAEILAAHNTSSDPSLLKLRFDALASHDITYVGIIQTARASGLTHFPLPYVLTNCHNSLCAVGGTINEDDHRFGLSAAEKYGGIYVPANVAVIHQYVREALVRVGDMILGSDSHTRYGALGVMGFGEGGPELVKQLLSKTYDIAQPKVFCVWLSGSVQPGVGPQDVALALIRDVFAKGIVKNTVLEFHGPGIANLSVEFRSGIDVMTTETTCLSSIWETDDRVQAYYAAHGRKDCYRPLRLSAPAAFDGVINIDLSTIEPMIALPFHPSNAWPIREVLEHPSDYLGAVDEAAEAQFGPVGKNLSMRAKYHDGGIWVEQGIIAGCAGGSFENTAVAAQILEGESLGQGIFQLSLYPASQVVAVDLVQQGLYTKAMCAGAIMKPAFCGPCFGAGDTPANGTLSIRHSTRNFKNREGSKPTQGQLAAVALMDARSIAATAANGGKLTPATALDPRKLTLSAEHRPDMSIYDKRVYAGFGAPKDTPLILGPNITDWPAMRPLPQHLLLTIASHITDAVTTTDELIPSGETSSLRSNPLKLAEFTLSRKDPSYVERAKAWQKLAADTAKAEDLISTCKNLLPPKECPDDLTLESVGFGSTIFAMKPGDGSAREQAASCQKVLGGWANLACEYATKRYRSNLINWGMLPFVVDQTTGEGLAVNDLILLPNIRDNVAACKREIEAWHISGKKAEKITLKLQELTPTERDIILAGCLINYYQNA